MSPQALYRACIKEAAAQARVLMERTVRRAGMEMPRLAAQCMDVVERNLLAEAAKVLMKHRLALCEAFPQALLAEFAQAIAGDTRKGAGMSFDALELMGEEQVQESVEVVRAQQAVLVAAEAELTELNALMCAAQGLQAVEAERNPLRHEAYVRALRQVIQQSPVAASVRRRWMIHVGAALGPELADCYAQLSAMLRSHGVAQAEFNAVQVPQVARPAQAGPLAAAQHKSMLTVHELRRLLSGELESPAGQGAPAQPDFPMTMPAAFETLQEMRQVEQVMQRLRQRAAPGHAATGAEPGLRGEARTPAQALGLEVVNLMVENIATDARLLPPVQQLVRELEPALMRLALGDPRFFSDRRHPARELLQEMTQRSLGWPSPDAPGFAAFIEPLRQAVQALLETGVTGAGPFDFALQTLREAWGGARQRDRRSREKAVRVLLQAEQRNLLAEKIAQQLRALPEMQGAPGEIVQFVTGPWSQVMAQARLAGADGSPDPGGYSSLVPELLWSAQPALAAGHAARLAKLLPSLVDTLRRGLASIDYPATRAQALLDHLAGLHRQALQPAAGQSSPAREQLEAQFHQDASVGSWLAPLEAQQSGFLDPHQLLSPLPLFQPTQPAAAEGLPPDEALLAPALPDLGLAPGAWVELFDSQWMRWQLTWASPHGTLYLLTHASGRTQSMTRRLLEKMLAAGTVRMVSAQAVVDGALDAVAQAALRNSAS